MAFNENLDLFFETSTFGVEVLINGKSVNGILDAQYIESGFSGSTRPVFVCKTESLKNVVDGSNLILEDGTIYKVRGPVEPDGTGVTTLILELQ